MALPDSALSTRPVLGDFLPPRQRKKEPLEDWERGGVALNNASKGLQVYDWRGRYIDGAIVLDVPGIVPAQPVLTTWGVTEFSFTFDQQMQPCVAYVVDDAEAFFYWFDATQQDFVTLDLPAGSITPRCSLDDKRDASGTRAAASDIILTYLRDGTLYYRMQRERYQTEHALTGDLEDYELGQFGMTRVLRMQWQFVVRQAKPAPPPNPVPVITALEPDFALRGGESATISLLGAGFIRRGEAQSIVRVNGADRVTRVISAMVLEVDLLAEDLEHTGELSIRVFNPLPGGGLSEAVALEVHNPVPTITSLSPSSAGVGAGDTDISVVGTGYFPESVGLVNGDPRPTAYVSSSALTVTLLASDLASEGDLAVSVANPSPGGGASGDALFSVKPVQGYRETVLADSPVQYYRLEETSGTTVVDETGTENLTIDSPGGVSLDQPGAVGRAYRFVNAGLDGTAPATAGAKSVEFLVQLAPSDPPKQGYIVARSNTFEVVINYAGPDIVGVFRASGPSIDVGSLQVPVPRDGDWHQVVITYDGQHFRGYLNGAEVHAFSLASPNALIPAPQLSIGRAVSNASSFVGGLDEVALYDYALTPEQVLAHYEAWKA